MFENGECPHITVVGDLILDRYLIGDVTKLNPEQPGVVIRVDKEEDRLGGAAAVAMIAAGLGAQVTLAGVVGRDQPGRRLEQLIATHGIEPHLWFDNRPTTWKQRIVARGQLRPDRCDREVTTPISDHAARFLSTVPLGDMVLISDYGKGACTTDLLRIVGNRASKAGVSILVDPARGREWSAYSHAALIKANWLEAKIEAGDIRHPLALANRLSSQHRCHVVVTFGARGMILSELGGRTLFIPPTQAECVDVCGAGDTVLAALAVALVRGESLSTACFTASLAAAHQVRHVGVERSLDLASASPKGLCRPSRKR